MENKFADEEVIIQAVQYIREREKDVDSEVDEKSEEEQIDEIVENKAIEANDTTV